MTRYLTLGEVIALHQAVIESSGGGAGLRDLAALQSALAQPRATFGGEDLHAGVPAKAAALAYSLSLNHPFIDGNKRVAHASMEVFLNLNGYPLTAPVDEQEELFLRVAAGNSSREELQTWLQLHTRPTLD